MSHLLPKSSARDFQLRKYWENFFSKRSSAFEWYGEYTDLCHVLHKYLKPSSRILMAGCGNSKLSEDLYDAGLENIDNIDISSVVIRQMHARNASKRESMTFTKMDILEMTFEDKVFDSVVDKGTLDAIFSGTDDQTVTMVDKMFSEISRVLKVSGRYICITLAQDHILEKILKYFEVGWLVRVHKVQLEAEQGMVGGALPVFIFVCTKMALTACLPAMKVYEYVMEDGKCVRCDEIGKLKEFVKDNQQYAMIEQHLTKLHVGEAPLQMDLWSPSVSSEPRYSLAVVDIHKRKAKNGPFAIFIVPQGREVDWLFCSDGGRQQLAESAGFERLVVVTMHRGHSYPSLNEVKEELSAKAVELAQSGLPHGIQHPVLSLGEGIGSRVVLFEGSSQFSGGYVIEECEVEGGTRVRRLVFKNNPAITQTDIAIVTAANVPKKKKKSKGGSSGSVTKLLHSSLSSEYHNTMIGSFAFLSTMFKETSAGHSLGEVKMLLVGLGGGALPLFISKCLKNITTDVVEIDPEMLSIAEKWFQFSQGEKMKVFIEDGVEFINQAALSGKKGHYDMIVLDADSKDPGIGMSSPPMPFLGSDVLNSIKVLLKDSGIFITNMVARDTSRRASTLKSLRLKFDKLVSISVPENVNEIVVSLPVSQDHADIFGDGISKVDEDLQCSVVTCEVTERIKNRIASLVKTISKDVDATILLSKLTELLSKVYCYR